MSIEFITCEAGQGMSLENDIYRCETCNSQLLDESIENGYLIYCPQCNPVSYCLKNGRPSLDKCKCDHCSDHAMEIL